jgi:hypothetical protein
MNTTSAYPGRGDESSSKVVNHVPGGIDFGSTDSAVANLAPTTSGSGAA